MRIIRLIALLMVLLASAGSARAQTPTWRYVGAPEGGYVSGLFRSFGGEVIASMYEHGAYISTDDGANWRRMPEITGLWHFLGGGGPIPLYVAMPDSIVRSTDRGLTWSRIPGATIPFDCGYAIDSSGVFIAVDGAGIRRSTDEGRSWLNVASYMSHPLYATTAIAVAGSGGIFYGVVSYPEETVSKRILRSTDHGLTWTWTFGDSLAGRALAIADDGTLYLAESFGLLRLTSTDTSFSHIYNIAVQAIAVARNGELIVATQYGVVISDDRGDVWSAIPRPPGTSVFSCAVATGSSAILAGSLGDGMFKTVDRLTWFSVNHGLDATRIATIGWLAPDRLYAASGSSLSISQDEGRTWRTVTVPASRPGQDLFPLRLGGPIVQSGSGAVLIPILDTLGFGLARTRDDGRTWTLLRGGPHLPRLCMVAAPDGELFAAGDSGRVYRSSDDGDSWRLFADFGVYEIINDIDFVADTVLFSHSVDGAIYLRSRLDGRPLGRYDAGPSTINQLVVGRHGAIYARRQSDILRSTDQGRSWSVIGPEIGNYPVDMAVDSLGRIFLSYDVAGGIYASIDGGDTWEKTTGLDFTSPSLVSTPSGEMLAGCGPGLFRFDIPAAVERNVDGPDDAALHDRTALELIPNPAAGLAAVRFVLDREMYVAVHVRNLVGVEVFSTAAVMDAGAHAVSLDVGAMAAGVYLCSVEADGIPRTARLVVIH
jgi:photosystem II stability/assembly factor-like uncharacterized protein